MASYKTDLTDKTHAGVVATGNDSNHVRVKSVLSAGGIVGDAPGLPAKTLDLDLAAYLAFLRNNGPCTYDAAAVALGCDAGVAGRG